MIALAEPDAATHPWDRAAAGWNDHTRIIHEWLRDATRMMLDAAHIKPGSRVLDIAAGAGDQTLDIARRVGENGYVLATDISARILHLAARNAHADGHTNVETHVADAESLGLAGSQFDAAVCRLGLMFCTDPVAALRGIHAALKPGGRFSALVFAAPEVNPCLAIVLKTAIEHAGLSLPAPFAPGTLTSLGKPELLAELLDAAGFVHGTVIPLAAPFHLPTSRHYVEFVRAAGSPIIQMLAPLNKAAQCDAWSDMEARLNQFNTKRGWVGPHQLLLCHGTAH
jgi:ubiquinone/menaquinone biosynthesis C-methylase UbiE